MPPCCPSQGGMGDASLLSHQRFIPKPPKRKKQRLERKRSSSKFNYVLAREALGLEANAHHFQVYSAAVALAVTPVETLLVNSSMKEEVKTEKTILKEDAARYKHKTLTLEVTNQLSARNAKRLELQVHSLSDSLKIKKKKSRVALKQLLTVTTMQHNEMITKFQVKIGNIQTEHDRALYKLQRGSGNKILNNQKSIEHLLKQHSKQMTQLESDYQEGLTHMENQHNKSMLSLHDMLFCIECTVTTHMQPFSVYF
jgi:hypothetical protein